jgi:hypothetical protein
MGRLRPRASVSVFRQSGETRSTDSKGLRKELLGSRLRLLQATCMSTFADARISVQRKERSPIIDQFDCRRIENNKIFAVKENKM